jgi:hypothetical protein
LLVLGLPKAILHVPQSLRVFEEPRFLNRNGFDKPNSPFARAALFHLHRLVGDIRPENDTSFRVGNPE